jgi:hypothetical protein
MVAEAARKATSKGEKRILLKLFSTLHTTSCSKQVRQDKVNGKIKLANDRVNREANPDKPSNFTAEWVPIPTWRSLDDSFIASPPWIAFIIT